MDLKGTKNAQRQTIARTFLQQVSEEMVWSSRQLKYANRLFTASMGETESWNR